LRNSNFLAICNMFTENVSFDSRCKFSISIVYKEYSFSCLYRKSLKYLYYLSRPHSIFIYLHPALIFDQKYILHICLNSSLFYIIVELIFIYFWTVSSLDFNKKLFCGCIRNSIIGLSGGTGKA
jgi:hypothetical protein